MKYYDNSFLKLNKKQKAERVYLAVVNSFEAVDSKILQELFDNFTFKQLEIGRASYLKYLSSFEQVLFLQNDPVAYLDGILTLKKCYESVGVKRNYSALINAYSIACKEMEQNDVGYKLWMQDALKSGILSKNKYYKLLKENTTLYSKNEQNCK